MKPPLPQEFIGNIEPSARQTQKVRDHWQQMAAELRSKYAAILPIGRVEELQGIALRSMEVVKHLKSMQDYERAKKDLQGPGSEVDALVKQIRLLPEEQRRNVGAANNDLKAFISATLQDAKVNIETAALAAKLATERADVTLPVRLGGMADGRIHPVSQVFD